MNRLFFILIIGLAACKSKPPQQSELPQPIPDDSIAYVAPRNVVFMIGDGMSLAQITALNYSNGNRTVLEEFPYTALQKPFSATSRITDSAAAATAFACGVRTQNGVVGMDTSGKPVTICSSWPRPQAFEQAWS
ncbi:MAG: hypothetical protein KatS3mg030_025 [Saprospiraceae bacterium]|nr:MAG: hypothetical protein KatS3mg030_025 [Saprospiraceae bacterium]